jgi:glycosyltransferase involved in cell wall biosynthesis
MTREKKIDLIDVFDWHFVPAAVTIKNGLGIPFVFSVESLEDHRSPTANSSYNMAIKSIEWLGFYEAARVNVKSEWMKEEVARIYQVPNEKITVIPANTEDWISEVLKAYSQVAEAKKNAT